MQILIKFDLKRILTMNYKYSYYLIKHKLESEDHKLRSGHTKFDSKDSL